MTTTRRIGLLFLSPMLLLIAGCSGTKHQNQTAADWSTGSYVAPKDGVSRSANAARVLDRGPEKTDVTMQVESLRVPVHAQPSLKSRVIGSLDRGDAVTVLEWSRFYNAPSSDLRTEALTEQGVPTWAKVSNARIEGYVSARSLVDPSRFAPANSIAPSGDSLRRGSAGTPQIEGADYESFELVLERAHHPATTYRQSQLVLDGSEPSGLMQDRIDGFASVSLEEHDAERGMLQRRVDNVVRPLGPLDQELLASDSEGAFIDQAMIRKHLVGQTKAAYLESDGQDPDLELIVSRELGASMLSSAAALPQSDPRSIVVNAVGSQLASHSSNPYPGTGYLFVVLDDDEVAEAVATPIGIVYITSGMLNELKSDGELALVLGHEIAHVEGGHGLGRAANDHLERLSAYRRILALESAGELDGHIEWVLAEVEIPEDFKQAIQKEIRVELLAEARSRYTAGVENAMSELRYGSNRDLEIAADARSMSLSSAAGYDPSRIIVLLERFDANSLPYGGAQYPRARRLAAMEILEQLPPATSADGTILITCLTNDQAHEEISFRAMPALTEERASLLSEKTMLLEFEPPSEQNLPPLEAGIPLVALMGEEAPQDLAELPVEGARSDAGVEEAQVEGTESAEVILVDLMDMEEAEPIASEQVASVESETKAAPQETAPVEIPMVALVAATPVAEAPEDTTEAPVVATEPEAAAQTAEPIEDDSEGPMDELGEEDAEEPEAAPEVRFDPEHFTRFVSRREFNQMATPTEQSVFAAFISRHSELETRFLRFSVRGHCELSMEGPFSDETRALVIPDDRRLSVWCVRDGSKHRMADTHGAAHLLEGADSSFSLVNRSARPIEGWIVIGR